MSSVPHAGAPTTAEPTTECGWYRFPSEEPEGPNLAWCFRPAGHPDDFHDCAYAERVPEDDPRLVALAAPPADPRPSFDELLAAADQGGDALIEVMGATTTALGDAAGLQHPPARSVDDADPELVPGLTYARAAQITAAISRHAAVVDAAVVEVEAHIVRHGLNLAVRDNVRLGFRLGQQVIRPRDGACLIKLLWTVHDVQLVSYAPAINRRPGMPEFEVATVARFEAHPGRELSAAVVAAAAIAIVDALEVA